MAQRCVPLIPPTKEAETGGSLRVQGHPSRPRHTLSQKKKVLLAPITLPPRTDLLGQAHKSPCPSPAQLGKSAS